MKRVKKEKQQKEKKEHTKKLSKKLKIVLIIVAILIIASIIGFFVFNKVKGNQSNGEDNVAVQSVAILTGSANTAENRFSGIVVSQKTVKLQKDADRTIKKVYVEIGQAVKAGEKLFEYSTDDINAKIDKENLEVEKLQNSIINSQKQIDTMNAEKAANPNGDYSSYNLEIQALQNDIKQTQYNIQLKRNEIATLRKSLQNVVVKSEIDGIVQSIKDSENSGDNGMYYDSGNEQDNSYMTIMQTGQYRVKGTVNEQNMFSISVGDKVLIHSRVDENATWTGTIENIDTSNPENNNNNYGYYISGDDSSNKSSKYPFYITLDSMEGLMMGQHVYIEKNIGQEETKEGLWLSNYYIVEENGESFVWASNKKDKLEKRKIKIGQKDEDLGEYQILEGLTAEDYIAIPQEGLQEGKAVNKFDTMDIPMNMENGIMEDGMMEGGEIVNMEGNSELMMPEVTPEVSGVEIVQ